MKQFSWKSFIQKTGTVLIFIGAFSLFAENGTTFHKGLQITFVAGLLLYIYPEKRRKWAKG